MGLQVRAQWEPGCRDRTEHNGAVTKISKDLRQFSSWGRVKQKNWCVWGGGCQTVRNSWAMLLSMGFVLQARQGWHRIRGVFGKMNSGSTGRKILERGKASGKEARWTAGCRKQASEGELSDG